jgi:cytidine deaminase
MVTDILNDELLDLARGAAKRAYAPYSSFPVGAAAVTRDGAVFTGSNVENSSFGLTICAERSAISAAVSAGHREIVAIAVSAPRKPGTSPCGACRQVMNEFRPRDEDMVVILDDGGSGMAIPLQQLLPRAFGPRNLDQAEQGTGSDS